MPLYLDINCKGPLVEILAFQNGIPLLKMNLVFALLCQVLDHMKKALLQNRGFLFNSLVSIGFVYSFKHFIIFISG